MTSDMMSSVVIFPFSFYYVPFSGVFFLFRSFFFFSFVYVSHALLFMIYDVPLLPLFVFLAISFAFDIRFASVIASSSFILCFIATPACMMCMHSYACGNAAQHSIHNRNSDVTDVPFSERDDDCLPRRFQDGQEKGKHIENYVVTFAAQLPYTHTLWRALHADYLPIVFF